MNADDFTAALVAARPHAKSAARRAVSRAGNASADDAASEATLRLLVRGSDADDTREIVARRLAGAARHIAIDGDRSRRAFGGLREALSIEEVHHPLVYPHREIDDREEAVLLAAEVLGLLSRLPSLSRAIVFDTAAGCSQAEIADRHQIPEGVVRVRLFRARRRLRKAMTREDC